MTRITEDDRLTPNDITLELLTALAILQPYEREAWINHHLAGLKCDKKMISTVSRANRKLRAHFGSSDALKEAA
jgi:hypothetical protein